MSGGGDFGRAAARAAVRAAIGSGKGATGGGGAKRWRRRRRQWAPRAQRRWWRSERWRAAPGAGRGDFGLLPSLLRRSALAYSSPPRAPPPNHREQLDGHGAADGSRGGAPDGGREGRPGRHRRHQGVGGARVQGAGQPVRQDGPKALRRRRRLLHQGHRPDGAAPDPDASVLFANRAHVNLLLGNHRRALDDAEQAVRLSPSNVKACYRAAKAALALNLLPEAASFCRRGFEQDPANEELKKLLAQVEAQQSEQDRQRAKVAQAITAAKDVAAAIEKRGLRLGKAAYQELTGVKKPKLDEQGMLHWPVLLLYPEVMSSDFIEDFLETDLFSSHLDVMFSESSPSLPWDEKHAYTRDAIELYYRSDEQCCNSCEDVREAYRKKGWGVSNPDLIDQCKREGFLQSIKDEEGEGCNIYGFLEVNKVAGNFHFAPGKSFQQSNVHVHDLLPFQKDSFNVSHKINKLSFGEHFPGVVNPLDGVQWVQHSSYGMYQYFIKVVPTVYTDINEHIILSNQFSVTEHFRSSESGRIQALPGVFFFYDLSPIKVTFTEQHRSFLHFLTNVCAIVGGVFTVSGIIDSFVYHGQRAIKKKMEIGKFN